MKYFVILLVCSFGFFSTTLNAQTDSVKISRFEKSSHIKTSTLIAPSVFILSGIYLNYARDRQIKQNFQTWIRKGHIDFHTNADDYLQWVPTGELIIAGLSGADARHSGFDKGKYYIISILTTSLVTRGLKEITDEIRPNGGMYSFPSGHTSNAFAGASVLYFEYKDTAPLLAWSGYIFATTTGVLRIYNNAHWVSDVLAGAGLGILIPQLVYHIEPLKKWQPFHKKGELSNFEFIPIIGKYTGFYAQLKF